MSKSFIVDKIIKLPCIPEFKKEDTNVCVSDLFRRKERVDPPKEVIEYFKLNPKKHHYYYENKFYSYFLGNIYFVSDTTDIEKLIEEYYEEHSFIFEELKNLVGKRITIDDLPLGRYPDFDGRLHIDCYDEIKPKILCSIVKKTGRVGGGGDGIYITKVTDFCEIYTREVM